MSEQITIYNIDHTAKSRGEDRKEFYDAQIDLNRKGKELTEAVGIFQLMLFNTSGEMILQKRSHTKAHNAYLIDKAVGGHISYGDTPSYTAMIETVQEMKVPSIVLREEEDFERTKSLVQGSLESVAILEFVDQGVYVVENILKDGERYKIAKNMFVYFGLYSGPIKPVDKEASGVLYYDLEVLRSEMKQMPDLFTPDLHFMMKKYQKGIDRFLKMI